MNIYSSSTHGTFLFSGGGAKSPTGITMDADHVEVHARAMETKVDFDVQCNHTLASNTHGGSCIEERFPRTQRAKG